MIIAEDLGAIQAKVRPENIKDSGYYVASTVDIEYRQEEKHKNLSVKIMIDELNNIKEIRMYHDSTYEACPSYGKAKSYLIGLLSNSHPSSK